MVKKRNRIHFEVDKVLFVLLVASAAFIIGIKVGIGQSGTIQSHLASEIIGKVADSDRLDGFDTSTVPAANTILVSDTAGKFPAAAVTQGTGSGLDADKVDGYQAADLLAQSSGGGGVLVTIGWTSSEATPVEGQDAPACPSGWTQAYAGYWAVGVILSGSATNSVSSPGFCVNSVGYWNRDNTRLHGVGGENTGSKGPYWGGVGTGTWEAAFTCRVCVK